ncbi:voltage-gated chloride channel, putative [Anopheles sinensis]|uniref:Voltage-gated chloride channel, putative n=1 Tax=Anopheles sinensis TaxID=74873 RepID=A0A084VQ50_ANOSI|nr:voltage-gated chloride channel, putative [Anopheles sinensis]
MHKCVGFSYYYRLVSTASSEGRNILCIGSIADSRDLRGANNGNDPINGPHFFSHLTSSPPSREQSTGGPQNSQTRATPRVKERKVRRTQDRVVQKSTRKKSGHLRHIPGGGRKQGAMGKADQKAKALPPGGNG